MLYFAYGSNLLPERIRSRDRAPSAELHAVAALPGHTLRFHKRGKDASGKCSIVRTPGAFSVVHGVVYELPDSERSGLDRAEGLGSGYSRIPVRVSLAGGATLRVETYRAEPDHVDDDLVAYCWYRDLVLAGAERHRLPPSWRDRIRAEPCRPDPDPGRDARARRVLGERWPACFRHGA